MATSFPNELDDFVNPGSTDSLSTPSHSQQHTDTNDAIEALEAAVGVVGSTDESSLTYKVNDLATQITGISNNTDTTSLLLGLEGNNDLTIYGIENATNVDSFAADSWRTVRYNLQVTKGSDIYTSEILATHDETDILISETNILSNTDVDLFTYTFEENQGIISLRITPISGEISVRFVRIAVKA